MACARAPDALRFCWGGAQGPGNSKRGLGSPLDAARNQSQVVTRMVHGELEHLPHRQEAEERVR